MKKTTILSVMAVLWLIASKNKRFKLKAYLLISLLLGLCSGQLQAQEIKPLNIGDKVPARFWEQEHVVYKNSKTTKQNLSAYKGKLLILDFWATWCGACLDMVPIQDKLRTQFDQRINILPVTYQDYNEVRKLSDKGKSLENRSELGVIGDNYFNRMFQHVQLPHYVWINKQGVVIGITGSEDINAKNIQQVLNGGNSLPTTKEDKSIDYSEKKALITQNIKAYEEKLVSYSTFSNHVEGLQSKFITKYNDSIRGHYVNYTNLFIANLLALAHADLGISRSKVVFELKDSTGIIANRKGVELSEWMKKYTYCYEMALSPKFGGLKEFYSIMRNDMRRYLPQVDFKVEDRVIEALVLVRKSDQLKFVDQSRSSEKSYRSVKDVSFKGVNIYFKQFIHTLDSYYLMHLKYPVIDNTGYNGPIILDLQANMNNLASINQALSGYDLELVQQKEQIRVLVIKNAKEDGS